MSLLDKLNFQTVSRQIERDLVAECRAWLSRGIAEQRKMLSALVKRETYTEPDRLGKADRARCVRSRSLEEGKDPFIQAR
jgi:hypothetical protein